MKTENNTEVILEKENQELKNKIKELESEVLSLEEELEYLKTDFFDNGSLNFFTCSKDIEQIKYNLLQKEEEVKEEANGILKHFNYSHLPESLQEVSKPICELAKEMNNKLPDCAEKQAGLRKLLEAKDCFVRANLEKKDD